MLHITRSNPDDLGHNGGLFDASRPLPKSRYLVSLLPEASFPKKIPHLLLQVDPHLLEQVEGMNSASIELHHTSAGALPDLTSVFMSVCLDVTL